jgi:succinate dehydrogenase / fumarate reductase, membrane anchor subunit
MPALRMRSPLGRATGLGSAKEGVEHWWRQRLTAVALVPLSLWFVAVVLQLLGADYETARHAMGRPLPAVLMLLLVIAGFWHGALGLQVVIEDYVHAEWARLGLVALLRLFAVALAVAAVFAVLRMAFLP